MPKFTQLLSDRCHGTGTEAGSGTLILKGGFAQHVGTPNTAAGVLSARVMAGSAFLSDTLILSQPLLMV